MKKLILFAAISVLLIANLYAQGQAKLFIGPQMGQFKSEDAKSSTMFGAAARLYLSNFIAVEGTISYKKEDYENKIATATSYPIMVSGLVYLIQPFYVTAGGGWYSTKFDFSDELNELGVRDETVKDFGYHLGAGADVGMGNFRLTGDIKYIFLDMELNTMPGLKDLKTNFYVFTISVLFGL